MGALLLEGIKVLDLADEPLAMTGRMLAELGAEVVRLEPAGGDPLRKVPPLARKSGISLRYLAWQAGKLRISADVGDQQVQQLLQNADVVIETPTPDNAQHSAARQAPQAVWLKATPFGLDGPRANWRASDLGILAASGNLYATGYPDSPPLGCSEPVAYAHASAEAAFAIITALASGRPQVIDLSMQEAVMIANMGSAGQYGKTGNRGQRQGAALGSTREIWPCKDGFVSFGLRGGPSRVGNFAILQQQLAAEELLTAAWSEQDWRTFNPARLDAAALRAIEEPLATYFMRYSMQELHALAVATNLMLAPANTATEILGSEQLLARDMFLSVDGIAQFPARFFLARDAHDNPLPVQAPRSARPPPAPEPPDWGNRGDKRPSAPPASDDAPCWTGLKLLEFGSGAAGPITCRYFIEHGATVIRVESKQHPDFLRVMAASSPAGLEGSTLFDALNVGKQSITLNLKQAEGAQIARDLMLWADAVVENFAPKAMQSYGLHYRQMVAAKPDLVMLSTCLNGQTGPHKDYPGFGGQGAALAGFNYLTGQPDREPIGPFGTITDSLAPRFAASALAAALLYRRRTGRGLHLDVSQVEAGIYSLSPWLLQQVCNGHSDGRRGNRSERAAPHGVFPCQGNDRWIAIACWNDHQWQQLATIVGIASQDYADCAARLTAGAELEQLISRATATREATQLATQLQYAGVEAVPVADFADLLEQDRQLQWRDHFVRLQRKISGESIYERNGFRLSAARSILDQPAPLLGEHSDDILRTVLGYDATQICALRASGAVE